MSYGRNEAHRERIAEMQEEMRRLQLQNARMMEALRNIADARAKGWSIHDVEGYADRVASVTMFEGRA